MRAGALKNHWSTGESAKQKCFQCRFKKRDSSSTLLTETFWTLKSYTKSLIFVQAGNNAESIRISSNRGMNLICH